MLRMVLSMWQSLNGVVSVDLVREVGCLRECNSACNVRFFSLLIAFVPTGVVYSGKAAQFRDSIASDNWDKFPAGQSIPLDHLTVEANFLPPHLHAHLTKEFLKGYTAIVQVIAAFMTNRRDAPSVPALREAVKSVGRHADYFFQNGGRIEYALDTVSHYSANDFSPLAGLPEDDQAGHRYKLLPECPNDLEFSLVRRLLGLDPELSWGPYYTS